MISWQNNESAMGFLKIFEIDKRTFGELVDFFDFCTKDIGN